MTIAQTRLFSFRLPLVRPLRSKGNTLTCREGYLICLVDFDGHVGWGEVSPLPGFNRENLADVHEQLDSVKRRLTGQATPERLEELDGGFEQWLGEYSRSPSVRFGVEMAVLNLVAASRATSLRTLLEPSSRANVSVNALLSGSAGEVLEQARQAGRGGYRAVKLKVGRAPVNDDVGLTKKVREEIGNLADLRLDANQAWSLEEAVAFADGIAGCDIEYIEEPCRNPADCGQFAELAGINVALDESLDSMTPEDLRNLTGVRAVILKPTLLGGIERSMQFAREARRLDKKPVISSCFESSLGILTLAHLAAALGDRDTAAGLDTFSWFQRDILASPLRLSHGTLELDTFTDPAPELNTEMLTEVSVA